MVDPLERQIGAFLKVNAQGWTKQQLNAACQYMFRHASMFTAKASRPGYVLAQDRDWRLIWNEATRIAGVIPTVGITVH